MSNETSSAESVTQTADSPVTGTPATESATPQKPTLTLEEALKRIADLEHSQKNATEEVDRHRKKLSAYEKAEREAEAAKKAAEEAQLSEIERITKQHTELQQQHAALMTELQEARMHQTVERAASKLNFVVPPEMVVRLIDREIEYENGRPTNVEKLLEKLAKSAPDLIKQQSADPAEPPARGTPTIPAMNPGRSAIAAPGSVPPGRIPRLSDPGVLVPPGTVSKYQP